jgi:TetR/AcrR family transcriptional regulator, fatty acid metabolism regulator protein
MPKGIPITEEDQAQRRHEIMEAAVQLFATKGFYETSMREIAKAAGSGKSTLYDYFKDKDEILVSFFEDQIQEITQQAEKINQSDQPAAEKLRRVMMAELDYMLEHKSQFINLMLEGRRLSMESQTRLQTSRHAYQDLICQIIRSGIEDGSFRPVDPFLAMRILLAAITPVVFTTRPTGTPREMMQAALDIILKGIQYEHLPSAPFVSFR